MAGARVSRGGTAFIALRIAADPLNALSPPRFSIGKSLERQTLAIADSFDHY
jgi:hypothetical protein